MTDNNVKQQLNECAAYALEHAKKRGANQAEVTCSNSNGLELTVRLGETETIEYNHGQGLGITVYFGQHKGQATCSGLSHESIANAVNAAADIAQHTVADQYCGLPEKSELATDWPDCDLNHPWDIRPDQAALLAKQAEEAALNFDSKIVNSDGSAVSTNQSIVLHANSLGFNGCYATTRHSLNCSVIAEDKSGMQRESDYSLARCKDDLWTPQVVGELAAQKTLDKLDARRVKTGSYPMVFSAQLATSIWQHVLHALYGGAQYRKTSYLHNSLGSQIIPDWITVHENPFILKGLASSPFDNEGVKVVERDVIAEGVVQNYFLSAYSARRLDMKTTGHSGGYHNIIIQADTQPVEALLDAMGTGLLVTDVFGQGVNLITGDYSRGASGFWVENGVIQYPVEEVTIAGNLKEMLMNIQMLGNDIEQRSAIQSGSMLINGMMLGGA